MFAENDQYASLSICTHARSHIGLDAVYCPDCRESFSPHTKEYQRAVNRDRTLNIALVQPAPEHLYQPGEPGSVRPQLLCNSDSAPKHFLQAHKSVREQMLGPAPEHLCQPGEPGSVRPQLLCNSDSAPKHFLQAHKSVREQMLGPAPEHLCQPGEPGKHFPPDGDAASVHLQPPASAPEHSWHHWVEVYWVSRGLKRHQYFRYMWMDGRKLCRSHIPGGNVRSLRAANRMAEVEQAIDAGESPQEIEQLIKSWRIT